MKILFFLFLLLPVITLSQPTPTVEENIPYLVTFGKDGDTNWGDDDFCQIFFFSIPRSHTAPIYIRVFDPDIYGENDELKGNADTKTSFSVYGGKGCISDKEARTIHPSGNYKSGNLLSTKTFDANPAYDNNWYTFGPFNPTEGELMPEYGGYIFKIIAEGVAGNDGNLYRYFLSTKANQNNPIEGANSFTFEYSFRLDNDYKSISHIYPYIDDKVISLKQSNFDWDNDGVIRIISVAKNGEECGISGDNNWVTSEHIIDKEEKNTSYDIQFIKNNSLQKNNNVVLYITNQYGEFLPFFTSPIGGIPKYKYSISVKPKKSK
ncbi:MAG: hypothetical protein HY738_23800 [Bacteroidia bacterium]|nr:hypothetical protein [Bacteroidia bacterium]